MTDTRLRCDVCGNPARTVHYDYDREHDGNGYDTVSKTIDLCHEHAAQALQRFLGSSKPVLPYTREEFSQWASGQHWRPSDV